MTDQADSGATEELWRVQRRRLLGIIAGGMLIGAVVLHFAAPDAIAAKAVCVRVGIVLFAVWLAMPELERIPKWMFASLLGGVLMVVVRPPSIVVVVPALALLWSLRGIGKLFN